MYGTTRRYHDSVLLHCGKIDVKPFGIDLALFPSHTEASVAIPLAL